MELQLQPRGCSDPHSCFVLSSLLSSCPCSVCFLIAANIQNDLRISFLMLTRNCSSLFYMQNEIFFSALYADLHLQSPGCSAF